MSTHVPAMENLGVNKYQGNSQLLFIENQTTELESLWQSIQPTLNKIVNKS